MTKVDVIQKPEPTATRWLPLLSHNFRMLLVMGIMPAVSAQPSSAPLPRIVLTLTLGSFLLFPTLFQPALDGLYAYLQRSSIYTSSTFETWWTVILYAWIESWYIYVFSRRPDLRLAVQKEQDATKPLPEMTEPRHRLREGLTYITPLLLMDLTMIKKFAGVPVQDMARSGNYHITTTLPSSSYSFSASNDTTLTTPSIPSTYLSPTLHNFTLSSPLQTRRALPPSAPTTRQLVLQLTLAFLIYDSLFFLFHLSLHKLPLPALTRIHRPHHSHAEIHPQVTNQLDVVERLGLVMLANFSLNVVRAHVLTRTVFVVVFVWLLVEIHCGMDLMWGYDKILPRGWASGSRGHSKHHRNGEGHYEPFFCWWDGVYVLLERLWKKRRGRIRRAAKAR